MSPNSARKALISADVLGDQRFRHQVGELGDEDLLRRIAHPGRIVDHQRLRMDALEEMRRRDVVHVEGRILAQQHHVHLRQIGARGGRASKWSPSTSRRIIGSAIAWTMPSRIDSWSGV
jgi:hypothetical protein